ncbi:MAG: cation diffusion facilitator family transporter [Deltaproteobacteria bacterium]|nr:cation diffusion facilitator family transporter [Deltaproteobacteria bacterium]
MSHNHSTDHNNYSSARLFFTIGLNLIIFIFQIIGGLITGSLSLISDSLHNFSDAIALLISFIAIKISTGSKSTENHTFGLKRIEILAAVFNAAILIAISVYLFMEAWKRFFDTAVIDGGTMSVIAIIGFLANLIGVFLLKKDSGDNLNIKSAYLHLISDTLSSVAVVLGGVAIFLWKVYWLDPLLTVFIGLYVMKESFVIVMEASHILMMGAPNNVSLDVIKKELEAIPGVNNIHHAHIWMLNENNVHFEAHVDVENIDIKESSFIREKINDKLKELYPIHHTTLQFECDDCLSKTIIA